MGTNYYAVKAKPTMESPIHIGKLSYGWLFLFEEKSDSWRDVPVEWHTYEQVKSWLKKHTVDDPVYVIIDEYDRVVSYDKFTKMIETTQADPDRIKNPDNFVYSKNVDGYRFTDREFL